jgi:hypothetical protein
MKSAVPISTVIVAASMVIPPLEKVACNDLSRRLFLFQNLDAVEQRMFF